MVKLRHFFFFCSKMCSEAKEQDQFSEGKVWIDGKLDYLKRHVGTKGHLHAVDIVQRHCRGLGIKSLLQESAEEWPKFCVFIKLFSFYLPNLIIFLFVNLTFIFRPNNKYFVHPVMGQMTIKRV